MLVFVGDICLADNDFDVGFGVGSFLSRGLNPFSKITKAEGEIWFGNMECVLSNYTLRPGYNKDSFRSDPSVLAIDKLIDCYSVANNHIMEHGCDAFRETVKSIRNYGKICVGSNEQKTVVVQDGGKEIAITAFSLRCDNTGYISEYWYSPELEEIRNECNRYLSFDYRVAYVHWGVEFMPYPYVEQQKLARFLIDIGFDLVIGLHPHVVQGFEVYKDKFIFYSLGNFVFNMAYPNAQVGLVVRFEPESESISADYCKIDSDYSPIIVRESEIPSCMTLSYLNSLFEKKPNVEQYSRVSERYLKEYRKYHHSSIIRNLLRTKPSFLKGMILNFIHDRIA